MIAASLLPGDYDQNGIVDAADYVLWSKTAGTQAGYDTWRAHFGQIAGAGASLPAAESLSAAVPEPTSALLLIIAMVVAGSRVGRAV